MASFPHPVWRHWQHHGQPKVNQVEVLPRCINQNVSWFHICMYHHAAVDISEHIDELLKQTLCSILVKGAIRVQEVEEVRRHKRHHEVREPARCVLALQNRQQVWMLTFA